MWRRNLRGSNARIKSNIVLSKEGFCSHNIEIGVKRLKEYGLELVFMPNALKGIEYLQTHPQARAKDLKDGKLNEYLHEVDEECYERMELLVEQMKWVGLMNNVRSLVEEILIRELIYV